MNEDYEKFENLIRLLSEMVYHEELEEDIFEFENKIEQTGLGAADFHSAGKNYDAIDIIRKPFAPRYEAEGVKYLAEYYDGQQAPFIVCAWKGTFSELITLLKDTSDNLYKRTKGK